MDSQAQHMDSPHGPLSLSLFIYIYIYIYKSPISSYVGHHGFYQLKPLQLAILWVNFSFTHNLSTFWSSLMQQIENKIFLSKRNFVWFVKKEPMWQFDVQLIVKAEKKLSKLREKYKIGYEI